MNFEWDEAKAEVMQDAEKFASRVRKRFGLSPGIVFTAD